MSKGVIGGEDEQKETSKHSIQPIVEEEEEETPTKSSFLKKLSEIEDSYSLEESKDSDSFLIDPSQENEEQLFQLKQQNEEQEEEYMTFEETLKNLKITENKEIPFFLFQPNTNELKVSHKYLPPMKSGKKYTLVLDLDETLIHFDERPEGSQFLIRPYAQKFIKEVSEYYEVVIFTAALQDYADYILDRLDSGGYISHRLYRRHTILQGSVHQKDLSKLGRDLARTLIVDNNAENFQLQPDNGIFIKSWYDDPKDKALLQLAPLLIGKLVSYFRYCEKRI